MASDCCFLRRLGESYSPKESKLPGKKGGGGGKKKFSLLIWWGWGGGHERRGIKAILLKNQGVRLDYSVTSDYLFREKKSERCERASGYNLDEILVAVHLVGLWEGQYISAGTRLELVWEKRTEAKRRDLDQPRRRKDGIEWRL